MKKLFLLSALLISACAQPGAPNAPGASSASLACTAPLKAGLELNLYFGRNIESGGDVSDAQWADFVTTEVTPRFPDGLTVVNAAGQSRNSRNQTLRERSKLLIVVVFDAPAHRPKVDAIVEAYKTRFRQEAVFRVEHPVCAGV